MSLWVHCAQMAEAQGQSDILHADLTREQNAHKDTIEDTTANISR